MVESSGKSLVRPAQENIRLVNCEESLIVTVEMTEI